MKRRLFINSLSGVFQVVISGVLFFVTIPVFLSALGVEQYGLYSLIYAISGLGAIANFGFNTSLLKYLSEQGKQSESDYDIIITTSIISLTVVPIAAAISWNDSAILRNVFRINEHLINSDTVSFFKYILWTTVLLVVAQMPTAVLDSLQKIYLSNLLVTIYSIVSRFFTLYVLLTNPSLEKVGQAVFLSTFVWFLCLCILAKSMWGTMHFKGVAINIARIARKHISYGATVFATSIFGMLYEPFSKVLINIYLGLHEVAYFEIALRVKGFLWGIGERILYPIAPLLAGEQDVQKVKRHVVRIEQALFIVCGPLILMIPFGVHDIMVLWLQRNEIVITVSVAVISSVYMAAMVFVPTYYYLTVKNKAGKAMLMQLSNVTVNGILFIIFVPLSGYWGAVIAYAGAIVVSIGLSLYFNFRYFGTTIIFHFTNRIKWFGMILLTVMINSVIAFINFEPIVHICLIGTLNISVAVFMVFQLHPWFGIDGLNLRQILSSKMNILRTI